MAITVKHKFVSAIPDAGDPTIVQPSNWNDTHELTGLGTMAEQNANSVAITGGTISGVAVTGYVPTTETITAGTGLTGGGDLSANRTFALANTAVTTGTYGNAARTITQTVDQQGRLTNIFDQPIAIANTQVSGLGTASTKDAGVANGVATLDGSGTVPVSQLPAAVLGALNYQGTWNASTNTPTLTSSVGTKGYYYVVNVAGTTDLNGITDWQVGDWAVFNGTAWQKVDNTDAGGDVVGPSSATDNAITRFDGTTGRVIQNSAVTINDAGTMSGVESLVFDGSIPAATPVGTMWYDNATETLNFQQNNITQQIGEELFVYGKASAAITDSPLQIIYHTGTVGSSGVITFAPTIAGITDENAIIGVATESIALNGFGRITSFGVVHGITTNGTAFGETWADDDVIWYNPVTGNPTKVKPVAPNIKFQIGNVIKAGSGGSGSFQVNLVQGTQLGGTDSNVQLTSPTAAQLLTYSTTSGYWKNTSLAAGTGISVGNAASGVLTVTNSAPDQTVVLNNGTGISVTGTYPNFTVTNTAPSSGGTVTSVSGTTGRITSTGGTTPIIDLASGVATAGTTGSSTLIPVVTIDTYGRVTGITTAANPQGTVTSVTGTAPVVSSGGATPAISMAAANTTTNGYLTSTDWNTFNNKTSNTGTVTSVSATVPTGLSIAGSPITTSGTLAITYTAGYAIPTTASQTNWDTAYTERQQWSGTSTNLVAATGRTSLGGTTVGQNFFTLTNPTAVTFPRINADNTVSALDAATFRTAIGAGTGSGTVTSVSGAGSYGGLTLTGTVTSSGSLTLGGTPTGTWPISVSGSAASATTATTATNLSGGSVNATTGTFNGTFTQSGGYAYLGNYNSGTPTYPAQNNTLAIGNNFSGGAAETNLWNTLSPATYPNTSLRFLQQLTASTYRDLMTLRNTGAVAFGGTASYGTSGQLLQSNGDAAPTWVNQSSIAAGSATTATNQSGGTVSATSIAYSTTLTGGTGIVNLGSGQFYKDASGTILIGTTTSTASTFIPKVQVAAGSNSTATIQGMPCGLLINNTYNGATTGQGISMKFQMSSAEVGKYAAIAGIGDGVYSNTMALAFYTTNNAAGGADNVTEKMRLNSSGSLSIGNTTDQGAGALSVANGIYAESTGPFHLNATTVSANFTIPTNYNASSAGPITVNTGVTVTVSTGSTWVIV